MKKLLFSLMLVTLPLYASLSNGAAVNKAVSLWGPQGDILQRYNPHLFKVGVRSEGCAQEFTILGEALTSWDAAFTNYNLKLSLGTVKIVGPVRGRTQLQIPFYDIEGAVAKVQLWIDGAPFGAPIVPAVPTSPVNAQVIVDTTLLADGVHVACMRATDTAGNAGSSNALVFRVMQ